MASSRNGTVVSMVAVLVGVGVFAGIRASDGRPNATTWEPITATTKSAPRSVTDKQIVPSYRASPGTSAFVGLWLGEFPLLGLLTIAVVSALRARSRARAEAALVPGAPLTNGPAVVFGKVEGEPGDAPAVRVRIHQLGTEVCNKGTWSYTWRETRREVESRPFTLVRADGARVRVEPDQRVVIHERLVSFVLHDLVARERVAEISVGADVHITGELSGVAAGGQGAYRETTSTAVLRPPRNGPMIVADEPVGETDKERMRFHVAASALLGTLVGASAFAIRSYLVLGATGRVVMARPVAAGTWQTYTKPKNSPGYWVKHFALQAEGVLGGATIGLEDECGQGVYECAKNGACSMVPFTVSPAWPDMHQIGEHATLTSGGAVMLVISAIVASIVYGVMTRSSRPWYLREKVVDTGRGRLAESMSPTG